MSRSGMFIYMYACMDSQYVCMYVQYMYICSMLIDIFTFIDRSIMRLVVIEQRPSFLTRSFACYPADGRSIADISINLISTYDVHPINSKTVRSKIPKMIILFCIFLSRRGLTSTTKNTNLCQNDTHTRKKGHFLMSNVCYVGFGNHPILT